ncbi:hypothetical protein Q428_14325 [Fervidicella metallireducens AeB]|uniref:Major facilitator superfamily (MFS) profile domain-containing protein n=1 Tax=Fervidicella metallireducens AeB TaxID=1403537 RepID=A0A017RRM1_9CLOT|nr:MFS transporter [Fervidicella metallireducens]EYE87251.1 hypothetical protein Q428_14325 [Fervidicella metallireducens AeB]
MKRFLVFFKQFKEYKNLITNTKLMRIIIAGFISSLGSKISYFALLIKVYGLSNGRIQDLGFLAMVEMAPFALFGAIAGRVADRFSRKRIMIISDLLNAVVTISILFISDINLIYVTAFLASFVNVFRQPAQSALEPNLVDKEDIALMNSFKSLANNFTHIIGSACGAAIVGLAGVKLSFIIDGISFVISALIISTIFINEKHIEELQNSEEVLIKESLSNRLVEGFRILMSDKSVKLMTIIDLYMTFAMSMQGTLIYVFLIEGLKMTKEEAGRAWGILLASLGVGAIFGSMVIGVLVKKQKNRFKLFLNVLIFDAVCFAIFILNTYFPASVVIFGFLGCIGTAHGIILNTVLQDSIPDEKRGKAFAMLGTLSSPIGILSIFAGTSLAALISAKYVLLIAAALELLIAVGVRFTKAYREYNTFVSEDVQLNIDKVV